MTRTLAIELFKEMVSRPDHGIDLASAALLIALDEYPNLNVQKYICRIDTLASKIRAQIDFPVEGRPMEAIERINLYLFQTEGFHGNVENYYDPRNSFLNDVLERRTGIPITLSLVYLEIGKRLGLNLQGVGMPGHFIVKYLYRTLEIFVDPFRQGEILLVEGCKKRLQQTFGEDFQFDPSFLNSVSNHQILTRMLNNLKGIYLRNGDYSRALSVIEKLLVINPNNPLETRDRAAVHYKLGNLSSAFADWSSYLELKPGAPDSDEIKTYLKVIGQLLAMRN